MVPYFTLLLILCVSGGSLGTTTSPQQQNATKIKESCEVRDRCGEKGARREFEALTSLSL